MIRSDSLTAAQSPLISAPTSNAVPVAAVQAGDFIGPVATEAEGVLATQGSRNLTATEIQAPSNSLRPQSRDEDLARHTQPGDEPQIVARPLPADVSNGIVMARPTPHSLDVQSIGDRGTIAYQPRDAGTPSDYAPVPRYLIGVFR
jgi:hypothetical protein